MKKILYSVFFVILLVISYPFIDWYFNNNDFSKINIGDSKLRVNELIGNNWQVNKIHYNEESDLEFICWHKVFPEALLISLKNEIVINKSELISP